MCQDTCAAFTGPWSDLDQCPLCAKPHYHPGTRSPVRRFVTLPLGPWIQSLYSSPKTAELMHYRERRTENILQKLRTNAGKIDIYDDTICGTEYLKAVVNGQIMKDNILIQHSHDGAQLYRDKESNCYFSLFIIHNLPPDYCYKKDFVHPSTLIGGPNKPKHLDSFLFPEMYHLIALQREGLAIWDAYMNTKIPKSVPFSGYESADAPAMALLAGMVGSVDTPILLQKYRTVSPHVFCKSHGQGFFSTKKAQKRPLLQK
ncbi:hypothetical protein K435DRAFT_686061 [Dendrothele bispora CBS 962.96]|uniref:Uncharacterized protein n=1 Tax=Dendrothele bispora (strain CBS 962.96) TaxID=1314807 RepID=A0A4S8L8V6_DENBC|nr:hypothetical protein K435DRAFT_686061 [Dendrothele bispora CBS 962.96]